jgi:hypothetical protein
MQRPASLSDVDVAEAFNVSRIEQAVREDTQATTSAIDRNGDTLSYRDIEELFLERGYQDL